MLGLIRFPNMQICPSEVFLKCTILKLCSMALVFKILNCKTQPEQLTNISYKFIIDQTHSPLSTLYCSNWVRKFYGNQVLQHALGEDQGVVQITAPVLQKMPIHLSISVFPTCSVQGTQGFQSPETGSPGGNQKTNFDLKEKEYFSKCVRNDFILFTCLCQ